MKPKNKPVPGGRETVTLQPDVADREHKLEAKIVLVGSSGVGKTSIALRYKESRFKENQQSTIGASYFQQDVSFKDGGLLRLHIWDTAGQEKYAPIANFYYRGAHAALVCYSVTDDSTFKSLDDWIKKLEYHGDIDKMIKFVIGNKCDCERDERQVDFKSGKTFAEQRSL